MESVLLIVRVLLAVIFVGLLGLGWLLWQLMLQQGRLLLRLEAIEARPQAAGEHLAGEASTELPLTPAEGGDRTDDRHGHLERL